MQFELNKLNLGSKVPPEIVNEIAHINKIAKLYTDIKQRVLKMGVTDRNGWE